jgi:hypothetical protein
MVRAMVKWITCRAAAGCAFANQLSAPVDSISFKKLYVESLEFSKGIAKHLAAALDGEHAAPTQRP